jgi:hypothetical protein
MSREITMLVRATALSAFIVVLAAEKAKLEEHLQGESGLVFFVLFLMGVLMLGMVEVLVEIVPDTDWFQMNFNRKSYIQGWWLNYAANKSDGEIYNFALIKMGKKGDDMLIDGETFRASIDSDGSPVITPDGHFSSTLAKYSAKRQVLGFHFEIDGSDKVAKVGHMIAGNANYRFDRRDGPPVSFLGTFTTDAPSAFCKVIGHRIVETEWLSIHSLPEKYRELYRMAITNKWIGAGQVAPYKEPLASSAEQ